MVWKYYDASSGKLTRLKKECPRCKGSFLADHKDRLSCGRCGFTEFKKKGKEAKKEG